MEAGLRLLCPFLPRPTQIIRTSRLSLTGGLYQVPSQAFPHVTLTPTLQSFISLSKRSWSLPRLFQGQPAEWPGSDSLQHQFHRHRLAGPGTELGPAAQTQAPHAEPGFQAPVAAVATARGKLALPGCPPQGTGVAERRAARFPDARRAGQQAGQLGAGPRCPGNG